MVVLMLMALMAMVMILMVLSVWVMLLLLQMILMVMLWIFEFSTSLYVSSDCLVVCGLRYFVSLLCGSDASLSLMKCFAVCLFKAQKTQHVKRLRDSFFFKQRF